MLIHGKEYTPVAERVAAVHASGKPFEIIESTPLQMGDRWAWRCVILLDGKRYCGSAEVHLNARPGSADATDPMACAETSAIGRALSFAGVLSLDGIASADELTRNEQPQADELQAQVDALKIDFEQLYPDKPGIWAAVVAKQLGKIPQRWTPEMLVRMKGYYLQCQQRLTQLRQAAAAEIVLE